MRSFVWLAPVLALAACAQPIVSEKYVPHPAGYAFNGTGHGVYCLATDTFTLTVTKRLPQPGAEGAGKGGTDIEYSLDLVQTTVPDTSRLYRLGLNESMWSDDKIIVEYLKEASKPKKSAERGAPADGTGTCLLASISSDATDQSGASAKVFSKLILSAVTGVPANANKGNDPANQDGPEGSSGGATSTFQKTFRVIDQPSLARTVHRINLELESADFDIRVSILQLGESLAPALADAEFYGTAEDGVDRDTATNPYRSRFGIFARVPQTYVFSAYRIERKKGEEKGRRLFFEQEIASRDGLDPYFISIDRGAFTQRKVTINFSDGAVSKIETDKKSEILAFLNIPLDIVTDILRAPLSALTWDNTLTTARSTLITNQTSLISNQAKLIKAQQDALNGAESKSPAKEPGAAD